MCVFVCTMLGGEERRLGACWVLRPRGHQLDRSHMFVSQLPQTGLSVLDHLLHRYMLLKCFPNLGLPETDEHGRNNVSTSFHIMQSLWSLTCSSGVSTASYWMDRTSGPELSKDGAPSRSFSMSRRAAWAPSFDCNLSTS